MSRASHPRRPAGRPASAAEIEALYFALVESLPIVTYVANLGVQGSFSYVSPQAKDLLGFAPEEWVAKPRLWFQRLHPDDRRRLVPRLARAHAGGRPFRAEYRLLGRDGRARWIRDESQVVGERRGEAPLVQGTWTEITASKELERSAEGKARALRSEQAQLEQLVSTASHELTAPLRRIGNLSELLARRAAGRLDAESLGLLERIRQSAAGLQRLVAGLVEYRDLGRTAPSLADVALDEVLDEAERELAGAVAARGAVITRTPLPRLRTDRLLVYRVLLDLLDNALAFRGPGPAHIRIWAERAGGDWIISVRDNGLGLTPREAARVFSLFEAAAARKTAAGLRLSLPISKKIVETLGGRIWVESEPGEGSTFRFTLPAAPKEAAP